MTSESATLAPIMLPLPGDLPALIVDAGKRTAWRFVEFFTATIWNSYTREAYARAVGRFLAWCEGRGLRDLRALTPVVAAYIEQTRCRRTVKPRIPRLRTLPQLCIDRLSATVWW